jgi:hypothetical protein
MSTALEPPQPQGDIVNDPVAAHAFHNAVRDFVRARSRQEWSKRPRSLLTCLRLLWCVWLNLNAALRLWIADARGWPAVKKDGT